MRARFTIGAMLMMAGITGLELVAQTTTTQPQTPPMTSVLAGRKLTPPIRGEAALEFMEPKPERVKDKTGAEMVITKMVVRNASAGPIARLVINETWYDKGGATVTAGRGSIQGLLQPGEIATVTIETPWKLGMQGFQRQYAHANGSIKPVRVNKLEMPKATTTTTAPGTTAKPTTTAPATTTKKP
jgi:hypothetical protein